MRPEDRTNRSRALRLPLAAVLVLSVLVGSTGAQARPSHADLAAAKAKLNALNNQAEILTEQYDAAQTQLAKAQHNLTGARANVARADARAAAAQREISLRARLAYMGVGSQLDTILGASNLSELSDRLEFLNQIAGNDATVVTDAQVAGQRAAWARADLQKAVTQRAALVQRIAANKVQLLHTIGQQKALIDRIQKALQKPLYKPQPPPPAPAVSHPTQRQPAPPINGTGAAAAVAAAYSVIGDPYVYAAAGPNAFDCSGLTMWAWAHGGVSLPHNAAMQYDSVPHVSRTDLQPGDLLFFFTPIHHVAMYVGGGMMIEAPHTGAYVQKVPVYWSEYVGAGRP